MRKIILATALVGLASPALAQAPAQQFNPDQTTYEIIQRASDLAKYAGILINRIRELEAENKALKEKADAEHKPEAGALHGHVGAQPGNGKAEGSAGSGGAGVQPSGR